MNSIGYLQNSVEEDVKVQIISPPRQNACRDERLERQGRETRKGGEYQDTSASSYWQQSASHSDITNTSSKQFVPDQTTDYSINEILEEEEALVVAHRKEVEDTMEIVREEMKLLAEVDQPGSHIDNYVTQLNFALSRKAASLVSLQARLARFQHRLNEQEILNRKRVHR